jgi:hypothetical protein
METKMAVTTKAAVINETAYTCDLCGTESMTRLVSGDLAAGPAVQAVAITSPGMALLTMSAQEGAASAHVCVRCQGRPISDLGAYLQPTVDLKQRQWDNRALP